MVVNDDDDGGQQGKARRENERGAEPERVGG